MMLTLKTAIRRLEDGRPVYAEWHDGTNRRERIVQIKKTHYAFRLRTINDEQTEQLDESRVVFDDGNRG